MITTTITIKHITENAFIAIGAGRQATGRSKQEALGSLIIKLMPNNEKSLQIEKIIDTNESLIRKDIYEQNKK